MFEFVKNFFTRISSRFNKPDLRDDLRRSFDPRSLEVREVSVSFRCLIEHTASSEFETTVLITERELAQNKDLREMLLREISRMLEFSADDYEIVSIQIGERFKHEQEA